ncbi:killer cell lectin-like receptor subfamily F member 1 [Ruditapes philippinarum]|uniref:killer cell lectin-like receptor subfamily F member 1 n=1 Tax=Ruditapes philippinarum TaxID=129788 RepID=UPI00295B1617|nr:killer cell lectin-like receptor subfamily F member 1 [Ruditapes philippinarum]
MKIILVVILLVFGLSACAKADNSIENDFDELDNLVSDVKERIQSLRKKVKEELRSKCGKNKCSKKSCGDGWVSYNGNCYFFDNAQACNYEEARAFCKQRESVLLYVQDEAENAFIVGMLGRLKCKLIV